MAKKYKPVEKVKCIACGLVGFRQEVTCSECLRDYRLPNLDVEVVETKSSSYTVDKNSTKLYIWK